MTEATAGPKTPDRDRRVFDRVVIRSANAEVGVTPGGNWNMTLKFSTIRPEPTK